MLPSEAQSWVKRFKGAGIDCVIFAGLLDGTAGIFIMVLQLDLHYYSDCNIFWEGFVLGTRKARAEASTSR